MEISKELMLALIRALSNTYVIQEDQKLIYDFVGKLREELSKKSNDEET